MSGESVVNHQRGQVLSDHTPHSDMDSRWEQSDISYVRTQNLGNLSWAFLGFYTKEVINHWQMSEVVFACQYLTRLSPKRAPTFPRVVDLTVRHLPVHYRQYSTCHYITDSTAPASTLQTLTCIMHFCTKVNFDFIGNACCGITWSEECHAVRSPITSSSSTPPFASHPSSLDNSASTCSLYEYTENFVTLKEIFDKYDPI